jgi:hypothetical protein
VRSELMRGDMRPAYLAWLLAVQRDDAKGGTAEPPVPPGLAQLTAPQRAMVEFLRIDTYLLTAAASKSAAATIDRALFRRWLDGLSSKDKDAWLMRAADEPDLPLGGELLRAFKATLGDNQSGKRRTAAELRALAEKWRTDQAEQTARKQRIGRKRIGRQPKH